MVMEVLMRYLPVIAAFLLTASAPVALLQNRTEPPASQSTAGSGAATAPEKMSDKDIETKLPNLGYTQATDIVSTPEGTTAKGVERRR
jgi:hypothetical protein